MNILVAMDSLKGSLSSIEANKEIVEGLSQVSADFNIQTVPVAALSGVGTGRKGSAAYFRSRGSWWIGSSFCWLLTS